MVDFTNTFSVYSLDVPNYFYYLLPQLFMLGVMSKTQLAKKFLSSCSVTQLFFAQEETHNNTAMTQSTPTTVKIHTKISLKGRFLDLNWPVKLVLTDRFA